MNMETARVITTPNIVYLHGTFHQGDELQFTDHSRGRQCVTNSIAAIALSKVCAIEQWINEYLDQILKAGDVLYQEIRPAWFFNQNPLDSGLLECDDIPGDCDIFNRHFKIFNNGSNYCGIDVTEIYNCLHEMCQQAENYDAIIVMGDQCGAYASSLIYHKGSNYIFDPHSLNQITGMPCANGTSMLLTFNNIYKCAEYLVQCAHARHAVQLSVWKLVVTKMLQYKCGNQVLQFPQKLPQIDSISSPTFYEKEYEEGSATDSARTSTFCKSTNMKLQNSKPQNGNHLNTQKVCEQKRTGSIYSCQICSKVFYNKKNFLSHQKACKKHGDNTKMFQESKKKDNQKATHATQLKSKYITTTSEENIISDKITKTKTKMKDRHYEILKLQQQIEGYKKKNEPPNTYAYLRTQVHSLQQQISKLQTLVKDLTDRKTELQEKSKSIRYNLKIFENETLKDESLTQVTVDMSDIHNAARSREIEHQNPRKRMYSESSENINMPHLTKQSRYSTHGIDEIDNAYNDRKSKKREYMRQKRLSTEYRQKENLKERERIAQKRSNTEFRQKENLQQRERDAHRRSSSEFRQKENLGKKQHMKQKRLSSEHREEENLKQRQRDAQRRSSSEFRQKENIEKKQHIKQKRLSSEHREEENLKQRQRDAQRRLSSKFRQKENVGKKQHMKQKRLSTEYREEENLKQRKLDTQRRLSSEVRQKENLQKKEHMTQKRTSKEFRDDENIHKQKRTQVNTYGNNIVDAIQIFLDAVSQGPIYVCSSCLQTYFRDNVVKVSTLHPGKHQTLLEKCLTQYKSINGEEWLCLSCKREIYDGLVPKLSKRNKVGFPEKPQQLNLNRLEEFFIAPLSAFMTIRSLPVCGVVLAGQKLLIGSVVHVANDVGKTVSSLPRMLDDMDTVAVRIKRRKIYKTAVFTENVRPLKVVNALQYLIKNSEMYKAYNFQVPEKWLSHVENSMHDNQYFVEGKYPSATEEEAMSVEDVTDAQFEEISSAEMTQGNMDTMLTENQPNIGHTYDTKRE